ncbi:MAG: hypothetical protein R6U11_04015 [Bacteroidales bacterium]
MEKKDVDLMDLLAQFKAFIIKNFWFLIIITIIGAAVGFGYNKTKKPLYYSIGILSSWIEEDLLNKHLKVLQHQIDIDNHDYLAELTSFPKEKLKNISRIDYTITFEGNKPIKKSQIHDYFENIKTNIYFEVYAFDKGSLVEFEDAIINYFSNNENLQKMNENRQKKLKSLYEGIQYDVQVQKEKNDKVLKEDATSQTMIYIDNRASYISELVLLQNEVSFEIERNSSVSFEQNFSTPVKKAGSQRLNMTLFAFLFLAAGVIFKIIKNI